jgi:hypothetical protein
MPLYSIEFKNREPRASIGSLSSVEEQTDGNEENRIRESAPGDEASIMYGLLIPGGGADGRQTDESDSPPEAKGGNARFLTASLEAQREEGLQVSGIAPIEGVQAESEAHLGLEPEPETKSAAATNKIADQDSRLFSAAPSLAAPPVGDVRRAALNGEGQASGAVQRPLVPLAKRRRTLVQEVSSGIVETGEQLEGEADPSQGEISFKQVLKKGDGASELMRLNADGDLFSEQEEGDRSPASWALRLAEMGKPKTVGQRRGEHDMHGRTRVAKPLGPLVGDESAVLSDTAQRFLKPLIGIEPADISIRQGPVAAKITRSLRADAVAVGEMVLLSPGSVLESPQQLGLLAHEMTHVARSREPRFLPAVVRDPAKRRIGPKVSETMDEEGLARLVEGRVRSVAKARERTESDQPADGLSAGASLDATESNTHLQDWGGLPAPWDPLPAWMTGSRDETAAFVPSASVFSSGPQNAGSAVSLQRAEIGRSLEDSLPTMSQGQHDPVEHARPAVHPDLDTQAREVYTILKRRLAAEQRRQSL